MVPPAHREQVVQIGAASMTPPDDVVRGAFPDPYRAARHRAGGVQRPQDPALRRTGHTRASPEVQRTRGGNHPRSIEFDGHLSRPGA